MASLGVSGDPDGWLHAGGTMNSVIQQLADELGDADSSGGSGLRPHWYGPVADTYQDAWQQRRKRYDNLIGQARPAASAISDFGSRMLDFQKTAWDLERRWLEIGLVLTADGLRFTLSAHHASLPQELKLGFESLLGESEKDIAEMWHDIDGAVQDLAGVLGSAADDFEDFSFLEVAAIGFAASFLIASPRAIEGFLSDHANDIGSGVIDVIDRAAVPVLKRAADNRMAEAVTLSKLTYHHGDAVVRAGLRDMKHDAAVEVRAASVTGKFVKFGGVAATGIGVVQTAASTYYDIKDKGVAAGLEANAGNWTTTAIGIAAPYALVAAGITTGPVLVTVGIAVAVGVIAVGVGTLVQYGVDHRAAIGHAAEAVGHDASHVVKIGLKDLRNFA